MERRAAAGLYLGPGRAARPLLEPRRKRDRSSGRQPPPHREKLLPPRPRRVEVAGGSLPPLGSLGRGSPGGRRRRGRTGCVGPTRAPGLDAGGSFAPPRSVRSPNSGFPSLSPPPPPFFSRLLLFSFPLGPPPARLPLSLRPSALGPSCHHRLVLPRSLFPTQPALLPPSLRAAPRSLLVCEMYYLFIGV